MSCTHPLRFGNHQALLEHRQCESSLHKPVTDKRFPSHIPKSAIRSPQFWEEHAMRPGSGALDNVVDSARREP
jgi:hypothetical protein